MQEVKIFLKQGISYANSNDHHKAMKQYEKAADLYAQHIVNNVVTSGLRKLGANIHYHWGVSIAYLDKEQQKTNVKDSC